MSISQQSPSSAYFATGELLSGTKLRVERVLGRGGQGEVLLVVNEVSRQRQVIKLLHPELVRNEGAMARFVKEVQLMAMLAHPNIVKLLHTDVTTPEGARPALPYLLMEYMEGSSLAELLASPATSLRRGTAIRFFAEVADALTYSSSTVGLVHRDLKPANLFAARDAKGRISAKVLDFGISQLCEALTSVTSDDFLGTEHYAAPEQYTGRTSPKTDVYQLGVVLWETFVGYHPYHDKTTRQSIMYAQLEQVPPPLAGIVHDCPRSLSKIVEGMLDKDPRRRPPMDVVANTLREILADPNLAQHKVTCGRGGLGSENVAEAPAAVAVALAQTQVMAMPTPAAPVAAGADARAASAGVPLFHQRPTHAVGGLAATKKSADGAANASGSVARSSAAPTPVEGGFESDEPSVGLGGSAGPRASRPPSVDATIAHRDEGDAPVAVYENDDENDEGSDEEDEEGFDGDIPGRIAADAREDDHDSADARPSRAAVGERASDANDAKARSERKRAHARREWITGIVAFSVLMTIGSPLVFLVIRPRIASWSPYAPSSAPSASAPALATVVEPAPPSATPPVDAAVPTVSARAPASVPRAVPAQPPPKPAGGQAPRATARPGSSQLPPSYDDFLQ